MQQPAIKQHLQSIDKILYPEVGHNLPVWHLDDIVTELRQARMQWRDTQGCPKYFNGRALPSPEALHQFIKTISNVLFPLRLGPSELNQESEDGHDLNELEGVSVNEFSDHFVMDFHGFREANGLTLQSFQVRAQVQILPLNALRKPLGNEVFVEG